MLFEVFISCLAAAKGGSSHRHGGFGPDIAFVNPTSQRRLDGDQRVTAIFSNNDDSPEQDANNNVVKSSNDFPAWVKALTRWDDSEQESPSSDASTQNDGDAPFDSFPFAIGGKKRNSKILEEEASFSGMMNVEALVAAANETDEDIDLILPNINDLKRTIDTETNGKAKLFPFLDKALRWDEFVNNIKELTDLIPDDKKGLNVTFDELVNMVPDNDLLSDGLVETDQSAEYTSPSKTALTTENILQEATRRLDYLINGTNYAFSPSAFQSLILRASKALAIQQEASGNLTAAAYEIFEQAGKAPKATAEYTADLVQFANGVLVDGFAPLFSNYPSVKNVAMEEQRQKIVKAAEFATLSGAIYEDPIPQTHSVEHSIIAKGKTADIGWMVTDSIQYEQDFSADSKEEKPTLVRTFVLRGYDASDEEVDREGLLNVICTASPVPILENEKGLVQVHEGMLSIAQELLRELEEYIDFTSPSHKFVFTGHSIGGSLAILMMILLANDRGASFVRENFLRVFTFGSPPIFDIISTSTTEQLALESDCCSILDAFDLPTDIVYSYNQPWDPIVRLYTQYDPLYPLIDDIGEDGYTPWVSGPSRTLRPILKTILESWEGWPRYRENAREKLGQNYKSVGEQYILLPEPIRYLEGRLVSVNTQVPEIDNIVQISSRELLPALNEVFTLRTFEISYVSVAIRSFVHHFYPAYGSPVIDYAKKITEEEEKQ
mmetsp:Transcript_1186/g.2515  ORF Transcript_1186/g.2515 Transcript_1186/m.2515 type:complete len:722 (-) Transcript_1186:353-2518(-)